MKSLIASFALLLTTAPLHAAGLKLASYFGDHMVLQRDCAIHVWGDGDAGATVKVSVAGQESSGTTSPDGHWDAALKPMSAGGPHKLVVTAGDKAITLDDVLVGDVWLCSGQWNMQMPLKECDDADAVVKQADRHPTLRLCTVGKGWNAKPQTSADIKWRLTTPDNARNFSAVGYYFGSELLASPKLANVPLALIDSSFGGTTCEGWIPNPALAQFDAKELHDSMFGIKPGMLYNAMIAPLGHSPIRGVVWYQGESNAEHPQTYPKLLTTMIAQWREQFGSPELPLIVVQLPDFAPASGPFHWNWIREAQAKAVAQTPHAALAQAINTTDGFDLHPKQKHEIGRRAALVARHDFYGEKQLVARGPIFKSATIDASSVRVSFDTAGDGLKATPDGGVRGFAIAGEDGLYRFADAAIDGDDVVLRSDLVPAPKTVRYAWAGVPLSTLTNRSGLPAEPFRTDQQTGPDVEVQRQPIVRKLVMPAYEVTVSGDGQVTSLAVRGKQFLSGAPGASGGTSIPVFFGGKSLPNVREMGPGLLSCSDDQVTLLLAFKPDQMDWTLTNRSKDPLEFRIALATKVEIAHDGDTYTLRRGKSVLTISGIDSTVDSDDGTMLQAKLKPGGAQTHLHLQIGGK